MALPTAPAAASGGAAALLRAAAVLLLLAVPGECSSSKPAAAAASAAAAAAAAAAKSAADACTVPDCSVPSEAAGDSPAVRPRSCGVGSSPFKALLLLCFKPGIAAAAPAGTCCSEGLLGSACSITTASPDDDDADLGLLLPDRAAPPALLAYTMGYAACSWPACCSSALCAAASAGA